MDRIVLTKEQSAILARTSAPVQLQDETGTTVGYGQPVQLTPEDVEAVRRWRGRTAGGRTYTGEQVQAHLQALQAEWDRLDGFDEAYMRSFLEKLRAQNVA
jgi:hypothetical protein